MSLITYKFHLRGLVEDYLDGSYVGSYVLVALDDERDAADTRTVRRHATLARYGSPASSTPDVVRRIVVPHAQWGAARRCLEEAKTRPDWDRAWATVRRLDGGNS